jgi:hypothetical protein
MFVRFRQTKTRLQASLVETQRIDGKVRHEHIAMLGSVDPASIPDRIAFWQALFERLAKLGNRIADQTKLLKQVHARIPMVTPDERRALQLENAEASVERWDSLAEGHADMIDRHNRLIATVEGYRDQLVDLTATATEHVTKVKDRIGRLKRGEDVEGGLDRPEVMDATELAERSKASAVYARLARS